VKSKSKGEQDNERSERSEAYLWEGKKYKGVKYQECEHQIIHLMLPKSFTGALKRRVTACISRL
jgi:hypothetical protein